jgi:predicted enzyme related to lactoylglutathione lyase
MTIKIAAITFDCEHPAVLASFWSEVFDSPVDPGPDDAAEFFASIGLANRSGVGPTMMFIKVPEGKAAKNRMHLDLDTDDVTIAVARLVELGATVVHSKSEWGVEWTTLTDPEGNEFCIASHGD